LKVRVLERKRGEKQEERTRVQDFSGCGREEKHSRDPLGRGNYILFCFPCFLVVGCMQLDFSFFLYTLVS